MADSQDVMTLTAPARAIMLNFGPRSFAWDFQLMLYGFGVSLLVQHWTSAGWQKSSLFDRCIMCWVLLMNSLNIGGSMYEIFHFMTMQERSSAALGQWILPNAFIQGLSDPFAVYAVEVSLALRSLKLITQKRIRWSLIVLFGITIPLGFSAGITKAACAINFSLGKMPHACTTQAPLTVYMWSLFCSTSLVTFALYWSLSREIRGFNRTTDSVLRYIIHLAFRTASYVAIVALTAAILSLVWTLQNPFGRIPLCVLELVPFLSAIALYTTHISTFNLRNTLQRGSVSGVYSGPTFPSSQPSAPSNVGPSYGSHQVALFPKPATRRGSAADSLALTAAEKQAADPTVLDISLPEKRWTPSEGAV